MTTKTSPRRWLIGLDEAGYGPNLGPLVQAAIALHLPAEIDCPWTYWKPCFRHPSDKADERLLVADSKIVHQGTGGFRRLEYAVLTLLCDPSTRDLGAWLQRLSPDALDECHAEAWFDASTPLGSELDSGENTKPRALRETLLSTGWPEPWARARITHPRQFNALVDRWQNKSVVLEIGVTALLQQCLELPGNDPLEIVLDKQGGRNFYTAWIQTAFPDGWVRAERESAQMSQYVVEGYDRIIRLRVLPKAEAHAFAVALASMLAKFLREVMMRQFNRYWCARVPGLKPTAGYPVDARRFHDAIQPWCEREDLPLDAIWRKR